MANPDYTAQDVPTWAANLDSMNSLKAVGDIGNPLLFLPLLNSLAFAKGLGSLTFARSTIATYIDRYGVLQSAAIDEPRFEKNGFLIEGASTNKILRSEEINNGSWTKSNCTISADAIAAPDGNTTMDKIVESSDGSPVIHFIAQDAAAPAIGDNNVVSATCFVKAAERTWLRIDIKRKDAVVQGAFVNLSTGTLGTLFGGAISSDFVITSLPSSIYRITFAADVLTGGTTPAFQSVLCDADNSVSYTGDGSSGAYIWGVQLEILAFASSYIPTTTVAVTRAKDVVTAADRNNVGNDFTILLDYTAPGDMTNVLSTDIRLFGSDDSRGSNYELRTFGVASAYAITAVTGALFWGIVQSALEGTHRWGFTAQQVGDDVLSAIWLDGVKVKEVTLAGLTLDHSNQGLEIGNWVGTNLSGNYANFRSYDRALSDREMAVA